MTLSAKYDYFPPSGVAGPKPSATVVQLATDVVTDWLPGAPNSLASGFSDLLGEMLKPEPIEGEDLWIVGPRMTGFEKQWKQVTSWILGVAFCRRVIENLGYRWWAPVSAFTSSQRTTLTPAWVPDFPPTDCVVERANSSILFPDYVLARTKSGGSGYEISFAESKGCTTSLTNLLIAPPDWKAQSQNASFIFRGAAQMITQYLLIATRVYARGKRLKTRRIQVRAWNERSPRAAVSFETFRDVIVSHYFGVCERIGLRGNAGLLAITNLSADDQHTKRLLLVRERLEGTAQDELRREPFGETWFYRGSQSTFKVGGNVISVGLSEPAYNLIKALQSADQRNNENIIRSFEQAINSLGELLKPTEKFFLRNDGVFGELLGEQ